MFLDTVKLVVRLPYSMESSQYDFRRGPWKKTFSQGVKRYVFSDTARKLIALGGGWYEPRIEYRIRKVEYGEVHELLLEFSIPKLLHGNNFLPTRPDQLDELYQKLLASVNYSYAFYDITEDMIRAGTLSRIDCMTTVKFPNIAIHNAALKRIASTSIDKRYEISTPRYSARSYGVSITCHSWQFVFYNKNEEVKRYLSPRKKMKYEANGDLLFIDNSIRQVCENNLAVFMQCEVRFNQKSKIDQALGHIGEEPRRLTLTEAIKNEIPRRVLQYYWQSIQDGLPRLDVRIASEKEVFDALLAKGLSGAALSTSFTAARAVSNYDMQELRTLIEGSGNRNTKISRWRRFRTTLDSLPKLSAVEDPVDYIVKAIYPRSDGATNSKVRVAPWCLSITFYYICNNGYRQKTFLTRSLIYPNARSPPLLGY